MCGSTAASPDAHPTAPLVVIIPCFNEAQRLPLGDLQDAIVKQPDWFWVLVDDGSRDGTKCLLDSVAHRFTNVRVLGLPNNSGKAEAVRQGLLWAQREINSPWVAYLDADFATTPQELSRVHALHAHGSAIFVMGCRLQRLGAQVERMVVRHYLGRVAATLVSIVLRLPTYDTQCGAKLLRSEWISTAACQPFSSRWLFDVEILARLRNHFGRAAMCSRVVEEPLQQWKEKGDSKLRLVDLVRVPVELWKLHDLYNRKFRKPS